VIRKKFEGREGKTHHYYDPGVGIHIEDFVFEF